MFNRFEQWADLGEELWLARLGDEGTIPWPGTFDGMLAAGFGTKGVNGAAVADLVQKNAISVGHLGKCQSFASGVEVLNEFVFAQLFEKDLGFFLKVKLIDQAHANQVV